MGAEQRNFDGLDADEREICIYLASCEGQFVSKGEIARKAGGKKKFQEDPNWATHPLSRLIENGTLEMNSSAYYSLPGVEKNGATAQRPGSESQNGSGRKILIVDYDAEWRTLVMDSFQEAGDDIFTANDAIEGLVQNAGGKLDLLILDLNLDVESGLELLKLLKLYQPDARVILCTRRDREEAPIRAMLEQGMVQYVRKGRLAELRQAAEAAFQN